MSTPTARTMAELRKHGWTCQIVERWNSFTHHRVDLFGVIDVVAVKPDARGVFGVQATATSCISSRMKKCADSAELRVWLAAGNRFAVVGWSKRGARGKRKTWQPVWRELTLEGLDGRRATA